MSRCYKKFRKDNCELCGVDAFTEVRIGTSIYYTGLNIHHLIPYSISHSNLPKNLITVCERCHRLFHTDENGYYSPNNINKNLTTIWIKIKKNENRKKI